MVENIFSHRKAWEDLIAFEDSKVTQAKGETQDKLGGFDGPDSADRYESSFENVLKEQADKWQFASFEEWAEDRKKKGFSTHVVDFFGGGYMFDDLTNVDSVTGVRLKNNDKGLENRYKSKPILRERLDHIVKSGEESGKRKVIEGNFFNPDTWQEIKDIDLAFIRPLGGYSGDGREDRKVSALLYYLKMLKLIYRQLSFDDGMLLVQAPIGVPLQELAHEINKIDGVSMIIDTQTNSNTFKLMKHKNAPERLILKILGGNEANSKGR